MMEFYANKLAEKEDFVLYKTDILSFSKSHDFSMPAFSVTGAEE